MTPNQGQNDAPAANVGKDVLEEVNQLDERLQSELVEDDRLSDGVPDDQRTDDLDFIQMSGLARPDAEPEPSTPQASETDVDSSRPVSFFERGVADVDPEMVPGTVVAPSSEDEELASTIEPEAPAADIADILAQLDAEDEALSASESGGASTDFEEASVVPGAATRDVIEEEPANETQAEAVEEALREPAIEGIEELAELAEDTREPVEEAGEPAEEPALDEIEEILVALEAELPSEPRDEELDVLEPEPPNETIEEERAPLESMEEAALVEAEPPDEVAAETPADAGMPMPSADLLEAEQLIEELENQSREIDLEPPPVVEEETPVTDETAPTPLAVSDEAYDEDDVEDIVYDRPHARRGERKRPKGLRRGSRRRVARVAPLVAAVLVVIAGGYATREWTRHYWELPEARLKEAGALVAKGEFERASAAYSSFAAAYPNDWRRPEAQFLSASVLLRIHPQGAGEAKRLAERALVGFQTFIGENPGYEDAKLARAEVLMGMLYVELGEYEQALTTLSDQDLRLRDSGAKLPILRTLAKTHDRLGDYPTALKLYDEAAGDTDNTWQDRDYESLAQLYEKMSDRATSGPESRKYDALALEHWRKARDAPGLTPSRTREIGVKIGLLEGRLGVKETPTGLPSESGQEGAEPAANP